MSFKIHLIIVSVIIIAVYFAWQLTSRTNTPQPAVIEQETASPYSITVIHASWGLNCRNSYVARTTPQKDDPFAYKPGTESKLEEDNVLSIVSKLCDGKLKCTIPISPQALGGDPMPECGDKSLDVEYRCFSFDRPWLVQSSFKSLDIDCSSAASRAGN
jgi:hypothetical protein